MKLIPSTVQMTHWQSQFYTFVKSLLQLFYIELRLLNIYYFTPRLMFMLKSFSEKKAIEFLFTFAISVRNSIIVVKAAMKIVSISINHTHF